MCVHVSACEYYQYTPFPGGMVVKEVIRPATSAYQPIKPLRKHQKQSSKNTTLPLKVQEAKKKKHKHRESSVEQRADEIEDTKSIAPLLVSPRQIETFGDSLMEVCAQNRHTLLNFGRLLA